MNRPTRRSYLATFTGTTVGLAGCLAGEDDPPTDTDPGTDTATPTETESSTSGRLVVEWTDVQDVSGPVTVYPGSLQSPIREAATDGTVRGHAGSYVYVPEPVLPQLDAVRLESPDEVAGTYDLTASGGTRYRLLVGADPVDPPADATVTPVGELPAERREFVRAAIDPGERATVYHETELGEWVREDFFGGYFDDGEIYRGKEVQQTDAEFFSTTVWYILSLSPGGASDPVTLRLPEIDPAVKTFVDELLDERSRDENRTALVVDELPDAVTSFAEETEYLLTHSEVLAVELEP